MKNMENLPLSNVSKGDMVIDESTCPSCLMEREAKTTECRYCGIVYSQYYRWSKEKRTKITISGLYHLNVSEIEELQAAWSQVELMYLSQETHDQFLRLCLRLKSLPFAAYCYNERLKIFVDDEIASFQLQKIITLSREWFGLDMKEEPFPFNRMLMRMTSVLSGLGMGTGLLTLMTGLLTNTPGYYVMTGLFMMVAFTAIFSLARYLGREN